MGCAVSQAAEAPEPEAAETVRIDVLPGDLTKYSCATVALKAPSVRVWLCSYAKPAKRVSVVLKRAGNLEELLGKATSLLKLSLKDPPRNAKLLERPGGEAVKDARPLHGTAQLDDGCVVAVTREAAPDGRVPPIVLSLRCDQSQELLEYEVGVPDPAIAWDAALLTSHLESKQDLLTGLRVRRGAELAYDGGVRLLVLRDDVLHDCVVVERPSHGNQHQLRRHGVSEGPAFLVDLNPSNHAHARMDSAKVFAEACSAYIAALIDKLSTVEDAITGNVLKVEEQLIYISTTELMKAAGGVSGVQREGWSDVRDMAGLCELLGAPSPQRSQGTHEAQGVLMLAGPGTGKTWSTQQLAYLLAKKERARAKAQSGEPEMPLLPLIVAVQHLVAVLVRASHDFAANPKDLLKTYIALEWDADRTTQLALLQAYELRALVVILDGADEAAQLRTPLEELVLKELAEMRVVLSSRPPDLAGVDPEKFQHFVIYNLEPLSTSQQQDAIRHQLKDSTQFLHLSEFVQVRQKHDDIFREAFKDEATRRVIQSLEKTDGLVLADGTRNPQTCQRASTGAELRASAAAAPESAYLRELCAFLDEERLAELHKQLPTTPSSADESSVAAALVGLSGLSGAKAHVRKVVTKLGLLLLKLRQKEDGLTAARLWERIWRRTDGLYVATEGLQETFERVARDFVGGASGVQLEFGELKDPVRIHEKAHDDYATGFSDWDNWDLAPLPEAQVLDVLRMRVVVSSAEEMVKLQQQLLRGQTLKDADGTSWSLAVLRVKNKFCPGAHPTPTKFRNILNNVLLSNGSRAVFAEMQLHHQAILRYNNESHAHDHYNYFRALFGVSYGNELDAMLERAISFFEEVAGNPVQLSMLVLVFANAASNVGTPLPGSRLELYRQALHGALAKRLADDNEPQLFERALDMLRRVAVTAQSAQTREFRYDEHVQKALAEVKDEMQLWDKMSGDPRGVPLVKTLETGDTGTSSFQFKQCAALYTRSLDANRRLADALLDEHRTEDEAKLIADPQALLQEPGFLNTLSIGGAQLGAILAQGFDRFIDGDVMMLDEPHLLAMEALQWAPLQGRHAIRRLVLPPLSRENPLRPTALQSLAALLSRSGEDGARGMRVIEMGFAYDKGSDEPSRREAAGYDAVDRAIQDGELLLPAGLLLLAATETKVGEPAAAFVVDMVAKGDWPIDWPIPKLLREGLFAPLEAMSTSNPPLTRLELREVGSVGGVGFSDAAVAGLCTYLRHRAPALTELVIHNCTSRGHKLGSDANEIIQLAEALRSVPALRKLQLSSLDLGHSDSMDAVAAMLRSIATLKEAVLSGSNISHEGAQVLAAGLPQMPITSLDVLNNKLGDSADALVAAAREMPQLVTLCGIQPEQEDVDFSRRGLGAGDAKLLVFDLSRNQAIKKLNLAGNGLTGDGYGMSGVLKLAEALPQTKITELNVDGHALPIDELRGTKPTEKIDLSERGLAVASAIIIASCIKENGVLEELNLKGNNIGDDGMRAIGSALLSAASSSVCALRCDAFTVLPDTASLDLSGKGLGPAAAILKGLGPAAAILLAGVLRGNSSMTSLNLGGNDIGVEGGKALAAVLPQTKITSLNLGGNDIGVEGGKALAAVLPQAMITSLNVDGHALPIDELRGTKPTEKIDLSGNELGVASAIIIASCIKENGVLKELDLAGNGLTGDGYDMSGVLELAEALPHTKITSLDVDGHALQIDELRGTKPTEKIDLSERGLAVASAIIIASCIKENGVLEKLNLAGNCLTNYGNEGVLRLAKAVTQNMIAELNLQKNGLNGEVKCAVERAVAGCGVELIL